MSHKKSTKKYFPTFTKTYWHWIFMIWFTKWDDLIISLVDMSGLFLWFANCVDLRISWLNILWKSFDLVSLEPLCEGWTVMCHSCFSWVTCSRFIYTQIFNLILLFVQLKWICMILYDWDIFVFSYMVEKVHLDINPLVDCWALNLFFLVLSPL